MIEQELAELREIWRRHGDENRVWDAIDCIRVALEKLANAHTNTAESVEREVAKLPTLQVADRSAVMADDGGDPMIDSDGDRWSFCWETKVLIYSRSGVAETLVRQVRAGVLETWWEQDLEWRRAQTCKVQEACMFRMWAHCTGETYDQT